MGLRRTQTMIPIFPAHIWDSYRHACSQHHRLESTFSRGQESLPDKFPIFHHLARSFAYNSSGCRLQTIRSANYGNKTVVSQTSRIQGYTVRHTLLHPTKIHHSSRFQNYRFVAVSHLHMVALSNARCLITPPSYMTVDLQSARREWHIQKRMWRYEEAYDPPGRNQSHHT